MKACVLCVNVILVYVMRVCMWVSANVTAGRGVRALVTSSLMVNLLAQHTIEVVRRTARGNGFNIMEDPQRLKAC